MRPLFASQRALIFKHAYIFEALILFQVCDTGRPHPENAVNLFIRELRQPSFVLWCFDNDFVRAQRPHFVVNSVSRAARFSLDSVQRLGMRGNTHLPLSICGPGQNRGLLLNAFWLKRAPGWSLAKRLTLTHHHPALRNGISSQFHQS